MVRISTPYLNNSIKLALAQRYAVLDNTVSGESAVVNASSKACPFGEDVRMVRKITQKQIILTPAEKDEVVTKYEGGMSMIAIAAHYGCHYTTVDRVLKQKTACLEK